MTRRYTFLVIIVLIGMIAILVFYGRNEAPPRDVADPAKLKAQDLHQDELIDQADRAADTVRNDKALVPLPTDPKTEAIAETFSQDRPSAVSVGEALEARMLEYLELLKNETYSDSLRRIYIETELQTTAGSINTGIPSHRGELIERLLRTRRFSKLVAETLKAKGQGNATTILTDLGAQIEGFQQGLAKIESQIDGLSTSNPQWFSDQPIEDVHGRRSARYLIRGYGSTHETSTEESIPLSIHGARIGVSATVYLVGLLEEPAGIGLVLSVAEHRSEPLSNAMARTDWSKFYQRQYGTTPLLNKDVVIDAIDRIFQSDHARSNASKEQLQVIANYRSWRDTIAFPDRRAGTYYPYDAASTPWEQAGQLAGVTDHDRRAAETISLPLRIKKSSPAALPPEAYDHAIDFARRLHEASDR